MPIDIPSLIASEINRPLYQISNVLELLNEGGTIPFIARYRKERTGEMNEVLLREILERFEYITELEDRKITILQSIESQGKLTEQLKKSIENCVKKQELEDIYLPYKPKRKTKATTAKEQGLEPFADEISLANAFEKPLELQERAKHYVNETLGVATTKEALEGAGYILAERISEDSVIRTTLRTMLVTYGKFATTFKNEFPVGSTKYEAYRDFSVPIQRIKPHAMLALRRAEKEGFLYIDIIFDEKDLLQYIFRKTIVTYDSELVTYLMNVGSDAFSRLLKTSLFADIRLEKKLEADESSVQTFEMNLKALLLAPPAGSIYTMGVDPGFRTGCKVAIVDQTGSFQSYDTLFIHTGANGKIESEKKVLALLKKYSISIIAIGNGTAGRETEQFFRTYLKDSSIVEKPKVVMVSEAGASVYSASELAAEEFPTLDLTIRGAISIARRIQDPLAELVKIDPKSIGVGQYQHDVDQKLLKKKLDSTVESCVNFVGVDVNTASKELLNYVAGIGPSLSGNIIDYRNKNGMFTSRKQLLEVKRFSDKVFEQSIGFMRILTSENPLDKTGVHPESYTIVDLIAKKLQTTINHIVDNPEVLQSVDLSEFVTDKIGLPTLKDIIKELESKGRDPRKEFTPVDFSENINSLEDVKEGMELPGIVTNVTAFGAFVDIGVHQDGLVHTSQLSKTFVKDPHQIVSVGQNVQVKVLEVIKEKKQIRLTMNF